MGNCIHSITIQHVTDTHICLRRCKISFQFPQESPGDPPSLRCSRPRCDGGGGSSGGGAKWLAMPRFLVFLKTIT